VISRSPKISPPSWFSDSFTTPRTLLAQKVGVSMRPSQTFQKRQRELARQEKQRAKAQRKQQRKLEKQAPGEEPAAEMADTPGSPSESEEPGS
jgi:hypothetical protein